MEYRKIDKIEDLGKNVNCYEVQNDFSTAKKIGDTQNTKLSDDIYCSDDEYWFKVLGVTAEPEIDDKVIKCDLFVHILNMPALTDWEDETNPFVGELLLIPQTKYIRQDKLDGVIECCGIEITKEILKSDMFQCDIMKYGYSIRLGDDIKGSDIDKMKQELANNAVPLAGLIGFSLDRPWNKIGSTGWDTLNELCISGEPCFKLALERSKGGD